MREEERTGTSPDRNESLFRTRETGDDARVAQGPREAENLFRDLIERTLAGVYLVQDGVFHYANPRLGEIYGCSADELIGSAWATYVHPEDIPLVQENIRRREAGEIDVVHYEYRALTRNGGTIPVEVYGSRTTYRGRPAVIGTLQDITERKKLEDALHASEERYRLLADNANDMLWIIDFSGKILYASQATERMTGWTPEEYTNLRTDDIMTPAGLAVTRDRIRRALKAAKEGRPLEESRFEVEALHKDGSVRWHETDISLVRDESGAVVAAQGVSRDITERKKLEEALRKSEERYRLLAENAQDMIWMVDLTGRNIYVSPSVKRMTGWTPEEAMRLKLSDILSPASAAKVRGYLIQVLRDAALGHGSGEIRYEAEVRCKDGSMRWHETSLSILHDTCGTVVAVQGVSRDITERKELEEELRKREEQYRLLAENASDMIWTMDLTGKFTYLSPATTRFWGRTTREMLDTDMADYITPTSLARSREHIVKALQAYASGESPGEIRYEVESRHKDGSPLWHEANVSLVCDESGKVVAIQGINRDITERKKLEEELRKSEERFRLLAENAGDMIWIIDFTGKILYVSPAVERITGWTAEEYLRLRPENRVLPDSLAKAREHIRRALRSARTCRHPQVKHFEYQAIRKDGSVRWIETDLSLYRDASGAIVAVQGVSRDIHEKKKLEEELRASEERYRLIAENAHDFIWIVDLTGKPLYLSPSAERMLGWTVDELMTMHLRDILTPPHAKAVYQRLQEAIAATEAGHPPDDIRYEVQVIRKDGSVRWHESDVSLVFHETGKVVAAQGVSRDITERKQLEDDLRRNEEQYRLLAENTNDMIWTLDRAGNHTYVSPSVERLTGWTPEEFLNLRIDETLTPASMAVTAEHIRRVWKAARAGHPLGGLRFEVEALCKDGSTRWHDVNVSFTLDGSGGIASAQGTSRDITERKKLEDDLRRSEERYRLLAENANDMIWSTDLSGKLLYVSPAVERLMGWTSTEVMGINLNDIVFAEDIAAVNERIVQAARDTVAGCPPREIRCEMRSRRKDGSVVWHEANISLVFDESGAFIAIQGVSRDITERKKLEDDLRRSEERYRLLADNSHDLIWISDPFGKPLYVSPAAERLLGWSREELMDMNVSDFVIPEDFAAVNERIVHVMRDVVTGRRPPQEIRREMRARRKDGSVAWHEASISLVRDDAGKIVGTQGVSRDVTERKRFEEALAKKADELARSNADLEQFAYIASHDLQEPLRMITGFTELLARRYHGKLGEDADEFISYVVSGTNRMKDLINALLDYSRVGTKGKPFAPVDCRAACDHAVGHLALAIAEHGAAIEVGPLPVIMGDEIQVIQLFQNLVGNAVKFHGPDPPRVAVSAQRNDGEWVFAIRDNGIGIEQRNFDRIFAIFQQVHSKKEYPGTGIGLAVCKKIVERHGGRIWVESEPGKGATFFFTLDARDA